MASNSLNTALENGYKNFLDSLNLSCSVYRMLPSGSLEVTTPCIFVVANKGSELKYESGIFKIPFECKVVYVAQDLQDNPTGLDVLTNAVETALTGSRSYINSTSNDTFLFSVTKPSNPSIDVVEHTYQYTIALDIVCKNK